MIVMAILLKVTLVLSAAAAIQMVLARRASAATRHLVWTLAIACVLLLPLFAISLPNWSPVEYTEPAGFVPILGAASPELQVFEVRTPIRATQSAVQWPLVVAMVYLAGVVLLLARIALQHASTQRLLREAIPIVDEPWLQLLGECTARIGVRRPVRLLGTPGDTMPLAAGIWQAWIVLPAVGDTWPEDRRRAVLLHELAHVARHDCLIQTVATVACAVYWVHPGVWWIAKRLRAERELACDDRVLAAGEDARDYAWHLLEIAYTLGQGAAPSVAVTMARPRELEGRLLAALDAARNRTIPALRNRLAGVAVLVGLTVPIAAVTITPRLHVLDADELRGATRGRFAQNVAPAAQWPAFEVASIKRTPDNTGPGADFGARPGGRLNARNNPVANFITSAYGVPNYLLIGGPEWMRDDRYDLEARADGEPPRAEMMLMLQTLLADRFQLRVHRETREIPAYVLTVGRGGVKLTPSKDGTCAANDPAVPRNPPPPPAPGETRLPNCGNNLLSSRGATPPNLRWTAVRIDMASLAGTLALYFRRPVVDRTGLTGFFDIQLELPPLQPAVGDAGVDPGVSVFTVLQEQLGLRVEEGRGPVEVLVVDRLERPTEN
jgi:uncharacterized protein (TIGR03435 family)